MVEDHTCNDENADAAVYVNDTRVPVTDVDLHMRKEGDLSVTRYAEGKIVSPWKGEDYVEAFDAVDEESQSSYDTVRIEVHDTSLGVFLTQFHGLVTGLGNSGGDIEREWVFRAQGPGQILSRIPASKNFTSDGSGLSPQTVLNYITNECNEKLPYDVSSRLNLAVPEGNEEFTVEEDDGGIIDNVVDAITTDTTVSDTSLLPGPANTAEGNENREIIKAFKPNRHTLADVVDWFQNKYNVRTWMVPTQSGATLIAVRYPHRNTHKAHYLDGLLQVQNNDALSELRPINTMVGKGDAKRSRRSAGIYEVKDDPEGEYAYAKVRHKQLVKRSGGTELESKEAEIDAYDKQSVISETKQRLKTEIDQASGGDMQTLPSAIVHPYDLLEAKPSCDGNSATDVPPVDYEIHRVHHEIRAGKPSFTSLDVGIRTSITEDLEVDEEGWKAIGQ
jgi:hypothetical protein